MNRTSLLLAFAAICVVGCESNSTSPEIVTPGRAALTCTEGRRDTTSHLTHLGCLQEWTLLAGQPNNASHGVGTAVKFVYSLDSNKLWLPSSKRFPLHWPFLQQVLKTGAEFDQLQVQQYYENPDRHFVLGTITRYPESGLWVFQLATGDNLSASHLLVLYRTLTDSVWFGDSLKLMPANDSNALRAKTAQVPTVTAEVVYKDQQFQCMNAGEAYGTLTFASKDTVSEGRFGAHTIVLTNGIPNDLPVVAGVITTDFQTPLSHVNVLSINRKTPNMALRSAWTDSVTRRFDGKLVHLLVTLDSFSLHEATLEEAEAFWEAHAPAVAPELRLDTTPGLVPLASLGRDMLGRVGAKASNFGELAKLAAVSKVGWKVPEGGFAIPFASYLDHLRRNGLDTAADRILSDSGLQRDTSHLREALVAMQARILQAPLDPVLLAEVSQMIRANGKFTRMRFRSSTNAEDMAEFNGAGLYSSFTGDLNDPKKPVADAIRSVWASLWNYRAFVERQFFQIDQKRVAMGILVHRSFPDEGANGVAVTRNLYMPFYTGYVINSQIGDVSVVSPPAGVTTEQLVYYPKESSYMPDPCIEYIAKSSLSGGAPVLSLTEIGKLGSALREIQAHFSSIFEPANTDTLSFGMDVEFKFDGSDRALYIKQGRPLP